mgnify:CR=1 FL=1|jgi:hypothetical protein
MSVELPDRPSAAYLSQASSPLEADSASSRPASPTFAAARSTHAYPQTPDLSLGESYTPATASYPPSTAAASLKSGSATPRSGSLSKDPLLKRQQQQRRGGSGLLTQWFTKGISHEEDRGRRRLSSSQVEAAAAPSGGESLTSRDSVRRIAASRRPWWHISREMAQRIVGFGMIAL